MGIELTIYLSELYYNLAAAQVELFDRGGALRSLVNAHQYRTLPSHDVIDHAMVSNMDTEWTLFEPPQNLVFREKNRYRNLSMGSMQMIQLLDQESQRSLLNLAEGEEDDTKKFMAPVQSQVRGRPCS